MNFVYFDEKTATNIFPVMR